MTQFLFSEMILSIVKQIYVKETTSVQSFKYAKNKQTDMMAWLEKILNRNHVYKVKNKVLNSTMYSINY